METFTNARVKIWGRVRSRAERWGLLTRPIPISPKATERPRRCRTLSVPSKPTGKGAGRRPSPADRLKADTAGIKPKGNGVTSSRSSYQAEHGLATRFKPTARLWQADRQTSRQTHRLTDNTQSIATNQQRTDQINKKYLIHPQ